MVRYGVGASCYVPDNNIRGFYSADALLVLDWNGNGKGLRELRIGKEGTNNCEAPSSILSCLSTFPTLPDP